MSKKNSKQKPTNKLIFLLILAALLCFLGLQFNNFQERDINDSATEIIAECNQLPTLMEALAGTVPSRAVRYIRYTQPNSSWETVWKWNQNEPFRVFDTAQIGEISLNKKEFAKEDQENIVELLTSRGFNLDELNSNLDEGTRLAFVKDQTNFIINYSYPPETTNILVYTVACGKGTLSKKLEDSVITEILEQGTPQDWLEQGTGVTVWELEDSMARINIYGVTHWGGGHSEYWGKIDNRWKKLVGPIQDLPECKIIEQYGIGKGLKCLDYDKEFEERLVR